jgi:hypothetical protein
MPVAEIGSQRGVSQDPSPAFDPSGSYVDLCEVVTFERMPTEGGAPSINV